MIHRLGLGHFVVVQAMVLLLTGCNDVRTDGPLRYEDNGAYFCTPLSSANNERTYAFGISFPPDLTEGISIDSVSLEGARDAEILATYLVLPTHGGVGVEPFPPATLGEDWDSATEATGQLLPVGKRVQVVAEVQVGEGGGSFTRTNIVYSFEGVQYETEQFLGLQVAQNC